MRNVSGPSPMLRRLRRWIGALRPSQNVAKASTRACRSTPFGVSTSPINRGLLSMRISSMLLVAPPSVLRLISPPRRMRSAHRPLGALRQSTTVSVSTIPHSVLNDEAQNTLSIARAPSTPKLFRITLSFRRCGHALTAMANALIPLALTEHSLISSAHRCMFPERYDETIIIDEVSSIP